VVIIDKISHIQLFKMDIRGGYRPVDCLFDNNQNFALAYSSADNVVLCNQIPKNNEKKAEVGFSLEESLHGREILAVERLASGLIVTGSEDGFVKISRVEAGQLKVVK